MISSSPGVKHIRNHFHAFTVCTVVKMIHSLNNQERNQQNFKLAACLRLNLGAVCGL